ncbi:MAG TPA: sigma 54-interacting transcriptional regulator [Gemmatimonadaceae bacterium]|nr:sigma 54-interacting transcriptional regulator [Gemmatimonadaceae bacterium]
MPTSNPAMPALPSIRALVIERDAPTREQVSQVLTLASHSVRLASTLDEGTRALGEATYDAALVDAALVEHGGLSTLIAAAARESVSVVAGVGDRTRAGATALRAGAHAWLVRPYDPDELLGVLERAGRDALRARELGTLRRLLGSQGETVLIGRSPAMQRLRELVQRASASSVTVLISGEAGTGKELVARTIHALSEHARGTCTLVECTDRDPATLEQELFGSSDGAPGVLTTSVGGTVIIDDATALTGPMQTRLLRVLQERALSGGPAPRLLITVREQRAPGYGSPPPRYDVLGRAGVFAIGLPPLRDRRSDIPLLAGHFRARFARETGAEVPALSADVVGSLLGYDWPGNVRQLEHYVGRVMLLPVGARAPFEAPAPSMAPQAATPSLVEAARAAHWTLEDLEREYIQRVLAEERGHQSRAAELLGIDRRTLYRKLKQYRAIEAARRRAAEPVRKGNERSA